MSIQDVDSPTTNVNGKSNRRAWPHGLNVQVADIRANAAGCSRGYVYGARRLARYGDRDLVEAALLGLVTLPEALRVMNGKAVLGARGVFNTNS
jgi:hypothetical protein